MMALPMPDLDDRRFQDLVDDAKRMVQERCPEWTDHNVSDPGITLIETFAFMMDQLLYRLNRVPDRLYVAFLDLIGVALLPPTAATADVTFWLSAPQPDPVTVPTAAEVSTLRTDRDESLVFESVDELVVPPRELRHVMTQSRDGVRTLREGALVGDGEFPCFGSPPAVGDVLLLGLDDSAPRCVVVLRFDCDVQGRGVDPRFPPLVWEAWDGSDWIACDVERDETGGLNRPGDVVLHLPPTHDDTVIDRRRAGWLRCRVVSAVAGYPFYSASPTVRSVSAFTIGGTVPAVHAEAVRDEVLGLSEGVPGQVFALARHPVVGGGAPVTVEVAAGKGWETWSEVESFADSGPDDLVFRLDRATGELKFPPAVREQDGSLRRCGAVPPKGAPLRVPLYRTGGGPQGNVAARTLTVLRTTLPFVDRADNRRPAHGGVAGETVEEAKLRGPLVLRTRDRAVTTEDFEELARRAAPELARVRCVAAGDGADAGGVRLLVVPDATPDRRGRLPIEAMVPSEETLRRVTAYLDERRLIGSRLLVEPPFYQGVTVVARLTARPRRPPAAVEEEALRALHAYFDPLTGGPDGTGWPFGRPVQAGEAYAVLQRVDGTELVDEVQLFAANPLTGDRGERVQRIELDRHAVAFSFDHQVRVGTGH
ncbi:MAG: putative baseplate assembly protein [Mycobacterium sp.]|jgi:predicted phage baseplate assembly protein|nr:putative baseplate assembly protein [Mycobacterium sp.]